MNFHDQLSRLERLDQLIRLKATGTPAELARKLDVSERTVYYLIRNLKERDKPVFYDKERQSYCYD
jgi:DNA-binding CsgD family transcriptional regulator